MTVKRQAILAFALGIGSLVAVLVGHLVLTDIHYGGEDQRLEWNVLRAPLLVLGALRLVRQGQWKTLWGK